MLTAIQNVKVNNIKNNILSKDTLIGISFMQINRILVFELGIMKMTIDYLLTMIANYDNLLFGHHSFSHLEMQSTRGQRALTECFLSTVYLLI